MFGNFFGSYVIFPITPSLKKIAGFGKLFEGSSGSLDFKFFTSQGSGEQSSPTQ